MIHLMVARWELSKDLYHLDYGGTYHSNQDLILCVKTGLYMGFGHIVGSDYYAYAGPAQPLATAAGEELNIRDRDFICLI